MYQKISRRRLHALEKIASKNTGKSKIELFTKTAYSGTLTKGAIKRLSKCINLLVESAEKKKVYCKALGKKIDFKLSFITLTIPTADHIEAKTAHKLLLEPIIKYLRQNHGLKNYVWKVELQKRGQLHYHITSDCYVDHTELRNKWNVLLVKNGFMREYIESKNSTNANSTDIHSVKKVRDLAAYLIKYFTKEYQNPIALNGKLWDCSLGLKKAKYYTTDLTQDLEYDISVCIDKKKASIFLGERFAIIKFKDIMPITLMPEEVKRSYYQNLIEIREFKRNLFSCPKKDKIDLENDLIPIQTKTVPKQQQLYLFN